MPRHVLAKHGPHPIDVHVGNRVRQRRTLLGMNQTALAEALGLTFQQVQKYEKGTNRISASKLWNLTQILDVPVSYFFEKLSEHEPRAARKGKDRDRDPLSKRETLELVRAYYRITDPNVRKRIYELVKALAKMEEN